MEKKSQYPENSNNITAEAKDGQDITKAYNEKEDECR
jgi:hypothetical protein